MTWTIFVLNRDKTFNFCNHNEVGNPPLVYLVPQDRLKEVRNCVKQMQKDFWVNNDENFGSDTDDYFEELLIKNNIDFKYLGYIDLTFSERKGDFLDKNIPMEYF